MKFVTRTRRPPSINIVSLIDILTILLIFFVITTTFKKAKTPVVELTLPESTTAQPAESANEPAILYVTGKGDMVLDDQPVPPDQLPARLRELRTLSPNRPVALEADEELPLRLFVRITDAAKSAGIDNLSMHTRPPAAPK